jgi:hypothetical protein
MKMIRQQLATLALVIFLFSCKEKERQAVIKSDLAKEPIANMDPDSTSNTYANVDKSPMDMSYYPVEYPKLKMSGNNIAPPVARVIYSRPHLSGRKLFHEVLKYGEHWRLGANEATEIHFFRDVTIQDSKIKPGRYILYCILGPDKWSVAINSNIDSWGLEQDSTKDIRRFDIPVTHGNPRLEYFTMVFEKTNTGANLIMAWDDVIAKLPISF